jgi:hypothetical protein
MGAANPEVSYPSATARRGTTKSIWTCGGIGEKKKFWVAMFINSTFLYDDLVVED